MSTTETKVTHTPGPWFVERAGRNPRVLAKPKGFRSTPENPVFVVTNNVYISADKDEATANAHLIAAAPDMLEALEATRTALVAIRKHILPHVSGQTRDFHEEIDAAAAAIAKAKGSAA